jgi:hypothetical protein
MNPANLLGWIGVVLVTLASSFWAWWGINEAFHEGWCKPYLWMRLLQVAAYLGPALVLCGLTIVGIRWPRIGGTLFVFVGLLIASLIIYDRAEFGPVITTLLTAVPALVGVLFLFGRPQPKPLAYAVSLGFPVLITIGFGVEPVYRISTRFDDGDRTTRLIEGNGVTLLWAPAGPGWARDGLASWEEANKLARHLTEDGANIADEPQDIWRLPTRDEVVRSLTRGDRNAGGTWDTATEWPSYDRRPDKESPLWDSYAPLIYLWTSDEADADHAWIVVYHGGVFAKPKRVGSPSFGFRAVRKPGR